MVTGAIETFRPCVLLCLSQWATTDGGRGLVSLTQEFTGGKKVVEGISRGFLPPPLASLDFSHFTLSKPPGEETATATLKSRLGPKWG